MLRRVLLLLPFAICFAADPARETADVIRDLASALTAGNAPDFLRHFDRKMPDYEKLRESVTELTGQGDTQSYVDVTFNDGDGQSRTLEITWDLRLLRTSEPTATVRPAAHIVCKLQKQGKQWRIVSFTPVSFFAP